MPGRASASALNSTFCWASSPPASTCTCSGPSAGSRQRSSAPRPRGYESCRAPVSRLLRCHRDCECLGAVSVTCLTTLAAPGRRASHGRCRPALRGLLGRHEAPAQRGGRPRRRPRVCGAGRAHHGHGPGLAPAGLVPHPPGQGGRRAPSASIHTATCAAWLPQLCECLPRRPAALCC